MLGMNFEEQSVVKLDALVFVRLRAILVPFKVLMVG